MKKVSLLFAIILMPVYLYSYDIEINGIYYNLLSKEKTASVTNGDNVYSGDIVIPETITHNDINYAVISVGEKAFRSSQVQSITIPKSVTFLGYEAFRFCHKLTRVNISDIAAWCNIEFATYSNPLPNAHHLFVDGEEVFNLVIPEGVNNIPVNAFNGCSYFTSISFPNSLTKIGNCAFEGCVGLQTLVLPENLETLFSQSFKDCTALRSVVFPNKITSIGGFVGCTSLAELNIPNNVTNIQPYGFQGCRGLVSLTIPNSVKEIGYRAFDDCRGLTSITIGSSVQTIGGDYYEFGYSFGNCPNLTDVTCLCANVPNTNREAFNGSYIEYATLHVPANSIAAYKESEPWKNFKEITGLNGEIEETPKCAAPTISFVNEELEFSCETEGVEYEYEVTVADAKKDKGNKVSLTGVYQVSVYATKEGYENSDVATLEFTMSDIGLKGDVNGDGVVDVSDYIGVANLILFGTIDGRQ